MSITEPANPVAEKPPGKPGRRVRRPRNTSGGASLAAQGEPMVWLTGGALATAILMVLTLLAYIVYEGGSTFWPGPVLLIKLVDQTANQPLQLMGEVTRTETYPLDPAVIASLPSGQQALAQQELSAGETEMRRQLLRSGNFELTGNHFHWLPDYGVESEALPPWAMVVERESSGRFYGIPLAIKIDGTVLVDASALPEAERLAAEAKIWSLFVEHQPTVTARVAEIAHKAKYELGQLSNETEQARRTMRTVELRHGKDSAEHQAAEETFAQVEQSLQAEFEAVRQEIAALRAENDKFSITFSASNATAELVAHELPLASIVRMYPANQLGVAGRLGVYLSRWREFLLDDPREANSEGGVWPAIVGTVTLTMIMALAVVPFGVLAALYLREYAKGGPIVSAVRIAINNLAGVPSIVFGVFGLFFFCYVVGAGFIDPLFYPAQAADHNPVYGKGALVWASLTLALLTLPVVVVAAEEALSAVPNSMREGSYACGAGKWQTIRRIVLPRALPGIMTGMILAMARGAGEVAPLMLVGAVKIAPDLTLDGTFPFLHLERSFMHLGFHIYDVGFQSQNSEAAKPMVFTTTFLLLTLIAVLNLSAIWLRQRLTRKFSSSQI